MKRTILFSITGALALLLLLVASCSPKSGAAGGAQTGYRDTLRIAVNAQPETLDIAFSTSAPPQQMMKGAVYESLVYQKGDYSWDLELAESCETNADSSVYTYKLRRGVKFHNGKEFTADDAVASLNRWLALYNSPTTGGAKFEKIDEYTITINLGRPMLYLNELLCSAENNAIIVPAEIANAAGTDNPIKEYIGTGPYKFVEWATDRYIRIEKFDGYVPYGRRGEYSGWGGYKEALTPVVYYYFAADNNTRIASLQTGEYDIAGIPTENAGLFENDPQFAIHNLEGGDSALVFNKKQGIAANPKFRQAVQAAVNTDDILLAAISSPAYFETDSSYIIPKNSEWYTKAGAEYYNVHDSDRAKRLLAEAGYQNEPLRILTSNTFEAFAKEGVVIEQQLKQAGFAVELIVQDWATYFSTRSDPSQWDAFITGFDVTVLPPFILYLQANWAGYADDPVLQNGLSEIVTATDKQGVIAKWGELQRYCLAEYVPVIKFGNTKGISVSSVKTEGGSYHISVHPWNITVKP